MTLRYDVGWSSHVGRVRTLNEDCYGVAGQMGVEASLMARRGSLFAVADGMGGHAAGEVASRLAVDTLFQVYYRDTDLDLGRSLLTAFQVANARIYERAQANEAQAGMGTTLVAAVLHNGNWLIANVGDSRAYLIRSEKTHQITRDHSWVAEQVAAGVLTAEEGRQHPYRNVVTRSLGQSAEVKVDLFVEQAWPGDALLLCSDGLSNMVAPSAIAYTVAKLPAHAAAQDLVRQANEAGGPDNITAVVVKLAAEAGGVERWLAAAAGAGLVLTCLVLAGPVAVTSVSQLIAPPTAMPTSTFTPTWTPTATASPTMTPSPTPTPTSTATPTLTPTPTPTPTSTPTPTPTPTVTPTPTPPPTPTVTPIPTPTIFLAWPRLQR